MGKKKKKSLASHVIILMILISLIMITSFTLIQLFNQVNNITRFNENRGRMAAIILKTRIEKIVDSNHSDEMMEKEIKKALFTLHGEKIVDSTWIIDKNQKIIASTSIAKEYTFSLSEKYMIEELMKKDFYDRWLYTFQDKETQNLDIYLPILKKGELVYLIRASFTLANIQLALNEVYLPVALIILIVIFINLIIGFALSKAIIRPIQILNDATKEIASGKLDKRVRITSQDEIQELGDTFNEMAAALEKMQMRAESANPLTKLPGNLVIHDEVETRIREGRKFVFIHSDLDNFKAYNDNYGMSQGDIAIKLTAQLLKETIEEIGKPEDFLGHEGGDDFVLITSPERAEELTSHFIKKFDAAIPDLYNEEDRKRGFIVAENRQGVVTEFPLISISLAGVSNAIRKIESYVYLTNVLVEVKDKAKSLKGSNFFLDRRKDDR